MEFPIVKIAQSRREPFVEQGEQCKDVVTGATGIAEWLITIESYVTMDFARSVTALYLAIASSSA